MGDNPPLTPPKEVRGREKSSKEDPSIDKVRKSAGKPASQKGGKRPSTAKALTRTRRTKEVVLFP